VNTRAHKDRTARAGKESGRDAPALEGAPVAVPPLFGTEGDVEAAGEEEGTEEVVNRDVELDEEAKGFDEDEVVGWEGNGGREVSTLPTVIVVGIMLPVRVRDLGMEKVAVADTRGEEKEPDIPLRVKNGENAV